MSRLDEALARARKITPEDLPPVPPSPASGVEPAFTHEPDASESVEHAAASIPVEPPIDEPDTPEPGAPAVEVEGDLRSLPGAEKLALSQAHSTPVEQYRRLAARLLIAQAEHKTKIVMISSAIPGEGKTLTAANLALTLSESYKKNVLLLDADLRHPSIHQVFQIPNVSGLNDGLRCEGERKLPLIRYTDNMSILTAGRPDTDPMSVLTGERLRQVFDEASSRFDWVIVDTPPVALLTDAHLLAELVDAVVLVIESGRTPLGAINKAVQSVGRDRILGVVLNRAGIPGMEYGRDYYYYAAHQPRA